MRESGRLLQTPCSYTEEAISQVGPIIVKAPAVEGEFPPPVAGEKLNCKMYLYLSVSPTVARAQQQTAKSNCGRFGA